jgi:hypothetical protein
MHVHETTERRETFRVDTTERRLDSPLRLLRIGAILAAFFAAGGIAHGIHEANPNGDWVIPIFAGIVAATGFAVVWHVLIGAITGMVRRTMIAGIFTAGIIVTAVALGASAQSIATAISGRSAMSAELVAQVDGYNKSLATAYSEATRWSAVPNAADVKGAGLESAAEMEASGANGKGAGQGPRYASIMDNAQSFRAGAVRLNDLLTQTGVIRDKGNVALSTMRDAAARGDQSAFMAGAEGVTQAIAELNAVDPKPIVYTIGAAGYAENGIDLSAETQDFYATAEKALADRVQVTPPSFAPLSMGDATRAQILGAAMHGWILAGAIDVLPFVFLTIAFFMSREVWHNQQVPKRRLTPLGRDQRDRNVLVSMQGGSIEEPARSTNRVVEAA